VSSPFLLAVMGPTGSGKTEVAEALASHTRSLLISADAFQVYRGFDIGTNKPLVRETWELIDICEPQEGFGAGEFIRRVLPLLESAWQKGQSVIVAGGTGLYIRCLFEEYTEMRPPPDPSLRQELNQMDLPSLLAKLDGLSPGADLDRQNPVRIRRAIEKALTPSVFEPFHLPPFRRAKVGLDTSPQNLTTRLKDRLQMMVRAGWMEETRALLAQGVSSDCPAMRAIGYQAWQKVLLGQLADAEAMDQILTETRQYAKRQRAWLRSEPELIWRRAAESESEVLLLTKDILGLVSSV
jgi:tRNA dimethylallyltransferase